VKLCTSIPATRRFCAAARARGLTIGLVPTMGALHEGHRALILRSVREQGVTVVSIFVNPAQFGPCEDFNTYPRPASRDCALAGAAGADALFMPSVRAMYPGHGLTWVEVDELADHLCGSRRPGHFRGVATVVAKLLNIIRPDAAYFGKKDFQQLRVIQQMARDLHMDTRIIGCPTKRERSGLALSSRNAYMTPSQRGRAPVIYRALKEITFLIKYKSLKTQQQIRARFKRLITAQLPEARVEYIELVDRVRLAPMRRPGGRMLLACAIRVGVCRLIDNREVSV